MIGFNSKEGIIEKRITSTDESNIGLDQPSENDKEKLKPCENRVSKQDIPYIGSEKGYSSTEHPKLSPLDKDFIPEALQQKQDAPCHEKPLSDDEKIIQSKGQPKEVEHSVEQDNPTLPDAERVEGGFWNRFSGLFNWKKNLDNLTATDSPDITHGSWEGLETAPHPNGSDWTIIPGNHFEQYSDIEKNYADHPRTPIEKSNQVFQSVNPADIEGVYLGDSEVENPDNFWRMHNGSKEAWMNTASHIPEIQERLDNGESLQSLLDDEKLGPCANAYFNPNNPQAIEVDAMRDGGFMFNGNGRHRIIAARTYGYEMPVRIVGQRE